MAAFWAEFRRLGGVGSLGYPISGRFLCDGFVCQAFQKAILQWRPEAGRAYPVNIYDELSARGFDGWLEAVRGVPRPASFDEAGRSWEEAVARRLRVLEADPAISRAYFGVGDWLELNGLPTSPVVDYGHVRVLRAQRVVIQRWLVDMPWAAAGQVVFANGGEVAKEAGLVPEAAATPQEPAPPVRWP